MPYGGPQAHEEQQTTMSREALEIEERIHRKQERGEPLSAKERCFLGDMDACREAE